MLAYVLMSVIVVLNIGFLLRLSVSRNANAPLLAQQAGERDLTIARVNQSQHYKRVVAEIARVSQLPTDSLEAQLDDRWTMGWSGAQDGSSLQPQLDFPWIMACRLRRRFIQHCDQMPVADREKLALRITDEWMKRHRDHFGEVLEYLRDETRTRPEQRGYTLRLAVATGLLCCARWASLDEVLKRVHSCRSFRLEIATRLEEIPGVPDGTKRIMPQIVIPDRDCLVSILVYAARHDKAVSAEKRQRLDNLLRELVAEGMQPASLEWNAWDAKMDAFDIAPLKIGEEFIDRRPADERFDWFKLGHTDPEKQELILDRIVTLLMTPF